MVQYRSRQKVTVVHLHLHRVKEWLERTTPFCDSGGFVHGSQYDTTRTPFPGNLKSAFQLTFTLLGE
jgi:hypothetical protein